MTTSRATLATHKRNRARISELQDAFDGAVYRAHSLDAALDREREAHARTRAAQQGFREGVEFAIRAMFKEQTHWRGSDS